MATYINGLTDYIPQIQPFQPDYNFLANVLQTRQTKYDANYNQLSSVYTSLLNSPMMREGDIKRKDEFFKTIDRDIKKVSGMDLSLQQNVDTAMKVFEPFYNDKNLVNDMVKTKKYQEGLAAHERYKNCIDTAKCGGEAWNDGLAEMQFKGAEFRNTTDSEALGFDMPSYTPYYNWKKDAMKMAKELDYNVKQDNITGEWIVHNQNGDLVKGGLYNVFQQAYGEDSRINANYSTKAYVNRKNTVAATIGQYGSEEAATRIYSNDIINNAASRLKKMQNEFNNISEQMGEKIKTQTEKQKTTGLTPDDADDLGSLLRKKETIDKTTQSLDNTHNAIHNNAESEELAVLINRADNAAAFELKQGDLMDLASTMSLKGKDRTVTANPYGVASYTSKLALNNQMKMAAINNMYAKDKISAELNSKLTYWDHTNGITSGALANDQGTVNTSASWSTAKGNADNKYAIYNENQRVNMQLSSGAKGASTEFLWSAFNTAKAAAKENKSVAQKYLQETYGPGWNKISSKDDFLNYLTASKKSPTDLFNSTVSTFNSSTNKDVVLDWADSFMQTKGTDIARIKELNLAQSLTADHITNNNKKIVKNIQAQSGPNNYMFKDADLMLTDNGFLISGPGYAEFEKKYNERYKGKGDAKVAFNSLTDKFLDTYRNTKGIVFSQGTGLTAGDTKTAYAIDYENVTPLRPQSNALNNVIGIMRDLKNSKQFNTVIGTPDEDNISGGQNDEYLSNFMTTQFLTDISKGYGKGISKDTAPMFSYTESPIAGNDANISAVTFKITNPKYLEQFIGTEKSPKALYAYKDALMEGITMYYNNKEVQTTTQDAMRVNPIEQIIKLTDINYDSWQKGGTGDAHYDPSTNKVIFNQTMIQYSERDHRKVQVPKTTIEIDLANYEAFHQSKMKEFAELQRINSMTELEIAKFYKLHPELLIPKS